MICPLIRINSVMDLECHKEKCAWWVSKWFEDKTLANKDGSPNGIRLEGCAIKLLAEKE